MTVSYVQCATRLIQIECFIQAHMYEKKVSNDINFAQFSFLFSMLIETANSETHFMSF